MYINQYVAGPGPSLGNEAHRRRERRVPRLTERPQEPGARRPASARAYEFYLRGTHLEHQRTFDNMSRWDVSPPARATNGW
jgi:hypothetical protein